VLSPEEWAEQVVPEQPKAWPGLRREIAAAVRAAVADEREACARACEELAGRYWVIPVEYFAAAVRGRGGPPC